MCMSPLQVTFLYIDFLDLTGTLYAMTNFINLNLPGAHALLACRFTASLALCGGPCCPCIMACSHLRLARCIALIA